MNTIQTPLTIEKINNLKIGDLVYLTGTIYTARDAAHKRIVESLKKGEKLPFDIRNSIIYYVGPCPEKPDDIIGSAGPTTSYRMDDYTIPLLELGLKGMIGKGRRSDEVIKAMKKHKAIYFSAIGGAGALIASCIKKSKVIAYEDLGTEAIREIYVEKFPLIVSVDFKGDNLYNREVTKYKVK